MKEVEDERVLDGDQGNDDGTVDDESLGLIRKCPKCGSEMWQGFEAEFPHESKLEEHICPWCGHFEKVKA